MTCLQMVFDLAGGVLCWVWSRMSFSVPVNRKIIISSSSVERTSCVRPWQICQFSSGIKLSFFSSFLLFKEHVNSKQSNFLSVIERQVGDLTLFCARFCSCQVARSVENRLRGNIYMFMYGHEQEIFSNQVIPAQYNQLGRLAKSSSLFLPGLSSIQWA